MLNVNNGSELRFALLEVVEEKQPMEIVFNGTEIYITFSAGRYNVTVNGQVRKFVNELRFKDYVFSVCGL